MTRRIGRHSRLAANWCQHCGEIGHLVLECHDYLLYIPRRSLHSRVTPYTLPAQRYAHDPGCLSLNEADNFVSLLSTIRQHLHTSIDTQQHYISIAREVQYQLSGGVGHQPCLDDFHSFVVNHWPTFRSIEGSGGKVLWGRVSKQADFLHEVGVLSTLVSAAEMANSRPETSNLPLPLYNLILTVVILHELSHSFTKYLFNNIVTIEGVGLLETQLMQGVISASWDRECDVGQMKLIKRVVLETDTGPDYIIDVDTAKKVLQSLGCSHLTPPSEYPLAESPGGDFRARVTVTTSLPKREYVAPIGFGFRSYVGSDRWETPW